MPDKGCADGGARMACKPDSVTGQGPRDGHSSGGHVAMTLVLPTRASRASLPYEAPIWHCSRWGLPCRPCCQGRGALLPHLFTFAPARAGGVVCFLWRFPSGYPGRALPGTVDLWSPDFPRALPPAAIRPSAQATDRRAGGRLQPTSHPGSAGPVQPAGYLRARSAMAAMSAGASGPRAQGRKRRRKAASKTSPGRSAG